MKYRLIILSLCLASTLNVFGAIPDLTQTTVNVSGSLKLKKEFSLTKLDPLFFIEGFKKIEVSQINDKTTEVKVIFMNDIFNEENLVDPDKNLKNEIHALQNLPTKINDSLTSIDKEIPCQGHRQPTKMAKMTPEFVLESVRATLLATAAFHAASLNSADVSKTDFENIKKNIEASMDKIFGTEKKVSKEREELLKKYAIASKDLDAREALLKSLDLFDEAKGQLKNNEVVQNIDIRVSIEKEGFAYTLTINKI